MQHSISPVFDLCKKVNFTLSETFAGAGANDLNQSVSLIRLATLTFPTLDDALELIIQATNVVHSYNHNPADAPAHAQATQACQQRLAAFDKHLSQLPDSDALISKFKACRSQLARNSADAELIQLYDAAITFAQKQNCMSWALHDLIKEIQALCTKHNQSKRQMDGYAEATHNTGNLPKRSISIGTAPDTAEAAEQATSSTTDCSDANALADAHVPPAGDSDSPASESPENSGEEITAESGSELKKPSFNHSVKRTEALGNVGCAQNAELWNQEIAAMEANRDQELQHLPPEIRELMNEAIQQGNDLIQVYAAQLGADPKLAEAFYHLEQANEWQAKINAKKRLQRLNAQSPTKLNSPTGSKPSKPKPASRQPTNKSDYNAPINKTLFKDKDSGENRASFTTRIMQRTKTALSRTITALVSRMYHGEVETSRQLELGLTVEMDSGEFKPKDYTFGYACSEQDDGQASEQEDTQAEGAAPSSAELPCPGSSYPVSVALGSLIADRELGVTKHASGKIVSKDQPLGNDTPYRLCRLLEHGFIDTLANSARNLGRECDVYFIDESGFAISPEALKLKEQLERNYGYFLTVLGYKLDENKNFKFAVATHDFIGGRGSDSIKPRLEFYLTVDAEGKIVHTDGLVSYKGDLSDIGVACHAGCNVHLLRKIIAFLTDPFRAIKAVADNKILTEEQKNQRFRSIVGKDKHTRIAFECYHTMRLIFHIDPAGPYTRAVEDAHRALKAREEIRESDIGFLFQQLDKLIVELDAVELGKNGQYQAKPNVLAGSFAAYFLNNRTQLEQAVHNPLVELSNNAVERQIKLFCLFRKISKRDLRSMEDIELLGDFNTIAATLELNEFDVFETLCQLYGLAYKWAALGYYYDSCVVRGREYGSTSIGVRLRDVRLDDPDTGFQVWADEGLRYLLEHRTLEGFESRIRQKVFANLSYSKRAAALKAKKQDKKPVKAAADKVAA